MWSIAVLLPLSILVLESSASADFQPIGFKDCKSKFKILDVQASGCQLKDTPNGKKLCEFKEGTTPRIRIKFVPDQTVNSLKTQIKAKIGQTFLEFPMADADACKYGTTCPVEAGKEYVYEKGIEIINNYPKDETVQVNWMVNKDDGKAVCIIFLARIVA
ncbi:ML domain protein [Ancylostoma duodenale]|uniref:ML domain protein n=1 Tax=Ancylostoma duodenale TaxID=51022 RepID=A0A0C2GBQ1_9BILA|nr:ML domain protein [Ancylostoma duodenale]